MSLGGSPDLYYITSAGTVSASCEGIPFTGSSYYNYYLYIDYTGDLGNPVVTNVTDDNYALFLKPDGGNFTYNAQAGTLTMEAPVTYAVSFSRVPKQWEMASTIKSTTIKW